MKKILCLLCLTGVLYSFFCGCSFEETVLRVSCDDFYDRGEVVEEIRVAAGSTFKVSLCSKPSTTLEWFEIAAISDETVIEQVDHKYVMSPPGGASGQEIWIFRALDKGNGSIRIMSNYSSGTNNVPVWGLLLNVTVY